MAGERASAPGYVYRVVVHLRESAGTAATIVSVDLTFLSGSTLVVSSHTDKPISDSANGCPANGSVDTREFVVGDTDASHAYATTVEAKVTFTDSSSVVGTTSATATVPPLSAPPPPQTFTLTGVITDANTHVGIGGARVEALSGVNAGKATTADSAGGYVLAGLLAETFRMRASADGYQWGEQNVTVPDISRADLELRRTPSLPNYAGVWTGAYEITECADVAPAGPGSVCAALIRRNVYEFTLSQSGTAVTGTYRLVSYMFSCPCGGDYGTFKTSGTVTPDGALVMSATGSPRATGLLADMTFNLRLSSPSTLSGTVSGTLTFPDGRDIGGATFRGTILSGVAAAQ